ncbi:hypothetical protein [Polyangium jinanense]|uniref:Lipoprotein n=1 Tax=Polyangium jinanense TaxID=2829994 RepID=A0A9X3XB09_9BACT|nr:hypothetical protein [Polyangium jinanense]MDC3956668.1 hypothetical protein [Polyangium jinanense]MDC3984731.1 hypothetical protein [Polyangium jinanense]
MRVFFCGPFRVFLLAAFLPACRGGDAPEATPAPAPPDTAFSAAPSAAPPRRPTIRHYLARTAERCEVHSVDRDVVSPATQTPCPQDLQVGERIRVMGKSCLREGSTERTQPVVCPGALLSAAREPPGPDGGAP